MHGTSTLASKETARFPAPEFAALQMQVQNSHSFSRAAGLPGLLVLRLVGGTPPGVTNGIGLGPEEWSQICHCHRSIDIAEGSST